MFIKAFSDFSVLCNLNWAIKQIPVPEAVPLFKKKIIFAYVCISPLGFVFSSSLPAYVNDWAFG